jgi:uncharacterized protein DUF4019
MSDRLIRTVLITVAIGLAVIGPAAGQGASSSAPSIINITADSAPGWRPSGAQMSDVVKATNGYFSLLDAGQFERAYAMLAEINRQSQPLAAFIQQNQEFHKRSGSLQRRDVLKITWTKDPAAAPLPGVYAAVDISSQFVNVERHCGFVVLYQKPAGGDFEIMRQESNFIDNASAQKIEAQRSRAVLDSMWAKLAANCPNYAPAEKR